MAEKNNMTNVKQLFLDEIYTDMSENLRAFLDQGDGTPMCFGDVSEINNPNSEESAVMAMGQQAANFNNAILVPLSGFPFAEAMLKIAQLNTTLINLLLSALQFVGSLFQIVPMFPTQDGITFIPGEWVISCQVAGVAPENVSSVRMEIQDGDSVSLSYNNGGDVWSSSEYTFEVGSYTATFSATVSTEGVTLDPVTVSFTVAEGGDSGGGGASGES